MNDDNLTVAWEDEAAMTSTGSQYPFFNLKQSGERAQVRILVDKEESIRPYMVHRYIDTSRNNIEVDILCTRRGKEDPVDNCMYCANGENPVSRIVIPLYNMTTGQIEYWRKSGSWGRETLRSVLKNAVDGNNLVSGYVFEIQRDGTGINTKYSITKLQSYSYDGRQKESFGEIASAIDTGLIKPSDYQITPSMMSAKDYNERRQNNNGGNNNNYQTPTATRRTTDLF